MNLIAVGILKEPIGSGDDVFDLELSLASSSGSVLISIVWFGMSSATCLSSARAARAEMQRFRTALVSSSTLGAI
ncbi:MAG: hypothetical protein CM15mP68_1610 [Pseudomonadota bacterium]|nr:MAG: hypothetical protein CM15mP68_1610 [Pseudomonadota bacterium]